MPRPLPRQVLSVLQRIATLGALVGAFVLHAAPCAAQPTVAPTALACAPGTGAWVASEKDGVPKSLRGVYCSTGRSCGGFASFDVKPDGTTSIRYAALPDTSIGCDLIWQGAVGPFALYHDGTRLLAISPDTLKVSWVTDLPLGIVEAERGRPFMLRYPDRLLILEAAEQPKITWDVPLESPRELVWQEDKLIVVEDGGMRIFPLVGGMPQTAQRVAFREPLGKSLYALDRDGLMREESGGRRIAWYGFEPDAGARTGLNADEEVREIGGAPGELVAVTTDGVTTSMVVRSGTFLRERLELRYWKLENSDRMGPAGRRPLVMRFEDTLILDGGIESARASAIDTSRLTWKPRARLSYPSRGQLVQMLGDRLVTMHPDGEHFLAAWQLPRGPREPHVARQQAQKAGLNTLADVRVLDDNSFLLRDIDGAVAVYDLRRKMLSKVVRAWHPKNHLRLDWTGPRHLAFSEVNPQGAVLAWHQLGLDASHSFIPAAGTLSDALNPTERWFGYCVPTLPCSLKSPVFKPLDGSDATLATLPVLSEQARDPQKALIFTCASLLLGLFVVVWRLRIGRRGKVDQQPGMGASVGGLGALLDGKGRRYITQREMEGFVDGAFTQLPWRLGIALAAGTAVAAIFGYEWLIVEPPAIAIPFASALATPVTVLTWVLVSWGVWNRTNLLRFGHAIEGQWFDSGTRKQSVCYTTPKGTTYRLRRGQWTRADLVPIILFDPKRPRFAAQYIGNGQFPVAPRGSAAQLSGNAVTRDTLRLFVVLVAIGATSVGGARAFLEGFPEPISEWSLSRIEANAEKDGAPMMPACFEACEGALDSDSCNTFCERRQFGHMLRAAGVRLEGTPDTLPSVVREQQLTWLEGVVKSLQTPNGTCDALAARVAATPRWTSSLLTAQASVFESGLSPDRTAEIRRRIDELKTKHFAPLCLPAKACLTGAEPCPEAPACLGPTEELQSALCGYAAAATPLEAPPGELAQDDPKASAKATP